MKKRTLMLISGLALSACFCFTAACGGNGNGGNTSGGGNGGGTGNGGNQGGHNTPITATIDMYTAINIIERQALEATVQAYEDYQFDLGNNIDVQLHNTDDPDSLQRTLRNLVSTGAVRNPTIGSVATLPEYHGTNKLVDLDGYLDEANPYNPDYDTWRDSLESDAYRPIRAGGTVTTPGVSYSSNYACMFYNKKAMKEVMAGDPLVDETGTIDTDSPDFDWDWMLGALKKASEHWKYAPDPSNPNETVSNFPLAISRNESSCGQTNFNLVTTMVNMYLDQYFRDFTEEVHSQDGDYSYINSIDSAWQYNADDPMIDYEDRYSYNLNRIVDAYFNHSTEFGPESDRYGEMMENLYDLMQYAKSTDAYNDCFNNFNRTTLRYSKGSYYGNEDMRLFYFETLGYVRTFRDAHKSDTSSGTVYPSAQWIDENLGWFLLPAMPSELEGVADNVRPAGGPLESYGVLSSGSTATDEIAVDFLRWLTSPLGQEHVTAEYIAQDAPQMMHQLVKGVVIDERVDFTAVAAKVKGDIGFSPYNIFAMGSGMSTCRVTDASGQLTNNYLRDSVGKLLSDYLKGSSREWTLGGQMLGFIKSGFASYADQYQLIYTDPAKVSEVTGGLKNNPFNVT